MLTEKGKALAKWVPSNKYQDEYDRIFKKVKEEEPLYECPEGQNSEVDNDHNSNFCDKK